MAYPTAKKMATNRKSQLWGQSIQNCVAAWGGGGLVVGVHMLCTLSFFHAPKV
jgi:hypothetical protein